MTLVQEAANIMEKLPLKSQQVDVDLLKMLSAYSESASKTGDHEKGFKRTGKSDFALPAMIEQQTADVDGVSGVTLTSNGLCEAVRNALAKAK